MYLAAPHSPDAHETNRARETGESQMPIQTDVLSPIARENHAPSIAAVGRRALSQLIATSDAAWPAILRVTLGAVMVPHAAQKTLGIFGGYGITGTMGFFTKQMHLPAPLAALVIFAEAAGSLGLVFGVLTRAAALGIASVMIGAIITTHLPNGFFMNWFGTQAGEGYEYHLLVLGIVAALVIGGGGRASVDRAISRALRAVS
jgi:putative oxidoreductase